jgi:serine/threonine-protein kinase
VTRAPGLAEGQASLGRIFAEVGAVAEARRRLEAALLLDPEVPLARSELTRVAALLGEWNRVETYLGLIKTDVFRRSVQRSRFDLWRRRPYTDEGYEGELAASTNPLAPAVRALHFVHVHGRLPEGMPDLIELALSVRALRARLWVLQVAAEVQGFLRDRERTLVAVEAAAAAGLIDRLWLDRCPLLDDARDDARFAAAHAQVARRTDDILADYHAP